MIVWQKIAIRYEEVGRVESNSIPDTRILLKNKEDGLLKHRIYIYISIYVPTSPPRMKLGNR